MTSQNSQVRVIVYSAKGWLNQRAFELARADDEVSAEPRPSSRHRASRTLPLNMLAGLLKLHGNYPFRPFQQPGTEARFMRRKSPLQKSLSLVFADALSSMESGLEPRIYTDELIASLKMKEGTRENFIAYLK